MNQTYQALVNQLDLSKPHLRDDKHGVLINYNPRPNNTGFVLTAIESYKSKRLRYFSANSMADLEEYFSRLIANAQRTAELSAERKAQLKDSKTKFLSALKPGVILTDSWGYEQTQVEFYIVREVKGSKVKIQELGHISGEQTSWASCYVMPDINNPIGEVITKTVASSCIRINSSIALELWDGRKAYKSWYY